MKLGRPLFVLMCTSLLVNIKAWITLRSCILQTKFRLKNFEHFSLAFRYCLDLPFPVVFVDGSAGIAQTRIGFVEVSDAQVQRLIANRFFAIGSQTSGNLERQIFCLFLHLWRFSCTFAKDFSHFAIMRIKNKANKIYQEGLLSCIFHQGFA